MATIYQNFMSGTLTADPGSGGTTIASAGLTSLAVVASPDTMWVTLDPDGVNGAPEIVKITAHTSAATTATVTRAQQSTTARAHPIGTVWSNAPTKSDMDELPFRMMTATGDIIYGSAANTASRLALGTTGYPLVAGASTPGYAQLGAAGIASDAVTTAKILDANVTLAKLAADSVDSSKIVAGSIVNADVNASAAIVASKLDQSAPTTWVPVVTQGASTPTFTNTRSKTCKGMNRMVDFEFHLAITASGTAGSEIVVTLPETAAYSFGPIGQGWWYNGSVYIPFFVNLASTGTFNLFCTGQGDDRPELGHSSNGTSTAALASGDVLRGTGRYEAAS